MKLEAVVQRLSTIQSRMEAYRDRPEVLRRFEDSFWAELGNLRLLDGGYARLPTYVGWLASFRYRPGEHYGAD